MGAAFAGSEFHQFIFKKMILLSVVIGSLFTPENSTN